MVEPIRKFHARDTKIVRVNSIRVPKKSILLNILRAVLP